MYLNREERNQSAVNGKTVIANPSCFSSLAIGAQSALWMGMEGRMGSPGWAAHTDAAVGWGSAAFGFTTLLQHRRQQLISEEHRYTVNDKSEQMAQLFHPGKRTIAVLYINPKMNGEGEVQHAFTEGKGHSTVSVWWMWVLPYPDHCCGKAPKHSLSDPCP